MNVVSDTLLSYGYQHLREVPLQGTCGLIRMIFTTSLTVGLDEWGYERRYCYERFEDARDALVAWDGIGDPPGPWIKEKPSDRRGPGASAAHAEVPA